MESGNVLLSQVFPHVLDPPLAAHMGEPNQVHSLTSSKTTGEMDVTDAQRKKPQTSSEAFLCGIRQRPTLPGRLQPSTIGAERLNFCVRYGNRWIPFAIVTGKL